MFGQAMQCLGNIHEIGKRSLLSADAQYLWWPHDKLWFAARRHIGVFVQNDFEDTLEQLIVSVITIGSCPGAAVVINYITKNFLVISLLVIVFQIARISDYSKFTLPHTA